MDVLTTATNSYITTISGFVGQFTDWGQWLFYSLLTINIVWMCLWYAFDKDSFSASMGSFIKKFFMICLFYTIMMNHSWLTSLLQSSTMMGSTLTGAQTDPSSIISEGIGIANKVIAPVSGTSLLGINFSAIIILIVYVIIIFVFMSIALQLALTLIITTALITFSTFFLGFAALSATSSIAKNTLDVILGNCMKLLGIYLVVACGSKTILSVSNTIQTSTVSNLDSYVWLLAVVILFWLVAKNLPEQIAKIISFHVQESHGHEAATMAIAASQYSSMALSAGRTLTSATIDTAGAAGKVASSAAYNAKTNIGQSPSIKQGISNTASDIKNAVSGTVSDHFSNIKNKMQGGGGTVKRSSDIPGVAARLYQASHNRNSAFEPPTNKSPTSGS